MCVCVCVRVCVWGGGGGLAGDLVNKLRADGALGRMQTTPYSHTAAPKKHSSLYLSEQNHVTFLSGAQTILQVRSRSV